MRHAGTPWGVAFFTLGLAVVRLPHPDSIVPRGGGGDGAHDPLVGTKVHLPYPTGVEVGTVTGVHRRKAGVVWVEYQNNPQLYEVARSLLFPTPEGAQEHLDCVCKGKGKANPPPPGIWASLTRKLTPCLTPKLTPDKPQKYPPTNPKAENNPTPKPTPDPTQQLWDPKTGSQEV